MFDHLGQVIRCESHVTTRLRYVRKSVVISGSLKREETSLSLEQHSVFVRSVTTDLSVPNGALNTKSSESGEASLPIREKKFASKET